MGISDEVGGKVAYLQTQNVKDFLPVLSCSIVAQWG